MALYNMSSLITLNSTHVMTLQRADKWGFDARVLTINFKNIQN